MAKQVKKEQIFKFEEVPGFDGWKRVKSASGNVNQGVVKNRSFIPAQDRSFDLDALNEIVEFIKGLDKGE